MHFSGENYLNSTKKTQFCAFRLILVAAKDMAFDERKYGVVFRYPDMGCNKVYIGGTKRALETALENIVSKLPLTSLCILT